MNPTNSILIIPDQPHIPEMGDLAISSGFIAGILVIVGLYQFTPLLESINLSTIFAVGFTVLIISILGIIDDLLHVRQLVKAMIPLVAALPLMAIKAGKSLMSLPLLGKVDFGLVHPLVLVPIGVAGAANAVNILAGFNGLEVGLGLVVIGSLGFIAWLTGSFSALLILTAAFGALLVTLYYTLAPGKTYDWRCGDLIHWSHNRLRLDHRELRGGRGDHHHPLFPRFPDQGGQPLPQHGLVGRV